MDLARLAHPCPHSRCAHLKDCDDATRRRADGGHTVAIVPSPKMDAMSLVASECSCGRYRSGPGSESHVRESWRQHADAKMGYSPPLAVTRTPEGGRG